MYTFRSLITAALLATAPVAVTAQGAQIAFGTAAQDTTAPVEVTADNLSVNQTDGTALFTGNVVIGQGEMRLSAPKVLVIYHKGASTIERLQASGGVTLVSGTDAAEGATADYNIDTGIIKMSGNVLLVQAASAIASEHMTIDSKAGTARMHGRVKTVLKQATE